MSDEFSNESRSLEVLPTSEMVLLIDDDNAKKDITKIILILNFYVLKKT